MDHTRLAQGVEEVERRPFGSGPLRPSVGSGLSLRRSDRTLRALAAAPRPLGRTTPSGTLGSFCPLRSGPAEDPRPSIHSSTVMLVRLIYCQESGGV